ncbi:MAG: aminoacyl-tRNA hydrolase [Clostridia bacterium]|nr:aminoacyl-tRNA hydrolase [Clostridia bacterium]
MFFGKKSSGPIDCLVVGLGNPGKKYEGTRHNAGMMALMKLAERYGVEVSRKRFQGVTGEVRIAGKRALLLFPHTYMNLSGKAVAEAMKFYKLDVSQLLVFSDDISLDPGIVRVRRKGSAGGQRGLQNIIDCIDSEDFVRIKLGIGAKPHPEMDLADWVLSRFTFAEKKALEEAAEKAAEAAELVIEGKIDEAMNRYSK